MASDRSGRPVLGAASTENKQSGTEPVLSCTFRQNCSCKKEPQALQCVVCPGFPQTPVFESVL